MTQIISVLTPSGVVQVADRLVSKQVVGLTDPDYYWPHDIAANKSLVLRASDGLAFLSYTGVSYCGGVPSDLFIARCLTGLDLTLETGQSAAGAEPLFPVRGLGWHCRKLLDVLQAQASPESRVAARHGLQVAICGLRWSRKARRHRPFYWDITQGSGQAEARWSRGPEERTTALGTPRRSRLLRSLSDIERLAEDAPLIDVANACCEAIEAVSRTEESVGAEIQVMMAGLPTPHQVTVRTHYDYRWAEVALQMAPGQGLAASELGLVPWLLFPGLVQAPTRLGQPLINTPTDPPVQLVGDGWPPVMALPFNLAWQGREEAPRARDRRPTDLDRAKPQDGKFRSEGIPTTDRAAILRIIRELKGG